MTKSKADILEVETETIPHTRTVEEAVKPDLIIFDKYEARCKELTELYGGIKINGLEDKDGYAKAKEAVRELRTMRTGNEGDRKAAKSFYLECGRVIDKKAEWIEGVVISLETPIKNQIKAIDDEVDRLRVERIEKEKERLRVRVALLGKYGAVSDGVDVKLDELVYSNDILREMEEDYFQTKVVPQFMEIFEQKEIIRLANEKAIREENERKENERKEFEKQQEDLRKREKEMQDLQDKIEFDKKRALSQRTKKRKQQLNDLGLICSFTESEWSLQGVVVHEDEVSFNTDEKWDEIIKIITPDIEAARIEIKKEKDAEQDRLNKEAIEKYEREQEEKAELARQKEKQQLEEGRDDERWKHFIKILHDIQYPVMTSRQYKKMVEEARNVIEIIIERKATRTT